MRMPIAFVAALLAPACVSVQTGCATCCESKCKCDRDENGKPRPAPLPPLTIESKVLYAMEEVEAMNCEEMLAGYLLGSPTGYTVGLPDNGSNNPSIRLVDAGFGEFAFTPGPDMPTFTDFVTEEFSGIPLDDTGPPILAMSLGTDVIEFEEKEIYSTDPGVPVNPEWMEPELDGAPIPGLLRVAEVHGALHMWVAFQFSVNPGEIIAADGNLAPCIEELYGDPATKERLGRTIFSYLAPQSDAEMMEFEYESVPAVSPERLLLGANERIDGLSMHMALYGTDLTKHPGVFTTRPLVTEPTIYFTLRPEFVTAIQDRTGLPGWLTAADGSVTANSSTIYESKWNQETAETPANWTEPSVFQTIQQLDPTTRTGPVPVIDGLAISTPPNQFSEFNDTEDHVFVYSLADTAEYSVPDVVQVQYVRKALLGEVAAGETPRRVVVRTRPGKLKSLGRALGAGRGCGDFCCKDPVIQQSGILFVDDYFVARRGLPPIPYFVPAVVHYSPPELSLESILVPTLTPHLLRPELEPEGESVWMLELQPTVATKDVPRVPQRLRRRESRPRKFTTPIFLELPGILHPVSLPELGLAVASYRQLDGPDGCPIMRTCMSWPQPISDTAEVEVWSAVVDLLDLDAAVDYALVRELDYVGDPLSVDLKLPDGTPSPGTRGLAAYWKLTTPSGRVFISPLSMLRF